MLLITYVTFTNSYFQLRHSIRRKGLSSSGSLPTDELNTCNLLMTNGVFPELAINISWLTFSFLYQRDTKINIRFRNVHGRSVQRIFFRHTREIGKKNSRNRNFIILTDLITGKTGEIDGSLCQSVIIQLASVQRQFDSSFLAFQQDFGFRFHFQVRRKMHQYRFVRTIRKIGDIKGQ